MIDWELLAERNAGSPAAARRFDDWLAIRGKELSATRVRLAVLAAVRSGDHLTAAQIEKRARLELGSVSTQGVYDALGALARVGLLRRLESAGSPVRYETRTNDGHHHLVCRRCRQVLDVECADAEPPRPSEAAARGFLIEDVDVTFWGLCRGCRGRGVARSAVEAGE